MMLLVLLVLCLSQQGYALNLDFKDAENGFKEGLNAGQTMIAFTAELSTNTEIASEGTIVFDREITNEGGLYFPNSGQFFCPDEGYYVFFWSIQKGNVADLPGMRCISKLRKGGTDEKFGPKTNYWTTATSGGAEMTTVIQCNTSTPTAITVVSESWSETPGSTSFYQAPYTSFSGFKLVEPIGFTVQLSNAQ